jgi:hypothetical protein
MYLRREPLPRPIRLGECQPLVVVLIEHLRQTGDAQARSDAQSPVYRHGKARHVVTN